MTMDFSRIGLWGLAPIMASVGLGAFGADGVASIPTLPPHPRLLFNAQGIVVFKQRIQRAPWAEQWKKTKEAVDKDLDRPIELPPRGSNWSHNYVCPAHSERLKTGKQIGPWQWEHICPVGPHVLHGDTSKPTLDFDGCEIREVHDGLAHKILNNGLAYQVTGDARYARKAREILLAYADRYLSYPLHNNQGLPRAGGHVHSQALTESSWLIPISQGADLIWDTLNGEERKRAADGLFLPALKTVIMAHGSGIHNIQNRNNSAIGLVGFLLGDRELIHAAINDPKQGCQAQMEKGVQSDGVWCEGAWGYHFFTIEGIWPLAEAARNCGIDLYGEKLKSLFDAPFALVMPNFNLPNFNDSGETSIRGHADLYELGYARYHNPGYGSILAQSSRHGSLALYFGVDEIPKTDLQPLGCHNATGSGYAMLRRGADDQATWVCLKYGPHGGGHGHFDKLSFILYARGHVIGVDAGTKRYASPLHKDWDKTTVAHNALVVDQESQQPAQGKCLAFGKEKDVDFAVADAGPIYEGVRFTRAMALLNENLVVVVDLIRSQQEHTYDIAYHQRGEWGQGPAGQGPAGQGPAGQGPAGQGPAGQGPAGQPWAAPDVDGYRRLEDATIRSTAGGIILSTDLGAKGRPAIVLGAGDKTEIITATGVGKNTEDRVPVVIFRRKTRETAFVWAVALDGAEVRFQTLSVCGDSGAAAPSPSEAVAVQVNAGSGAAWTLLVNPDAYPVRVSLPDGSDWSNKAVFSVR